MLFCDSSLTGLRHMVILHSPDTTMGCSHPHCTEEAAVIRKMTSFAMRQGFDSRLSLPVTLPIPEPCMDILLPAPSLRYAVSPVPGIQVASYRDIGCEETGKPQRDFPATGFDDAAVGPTVWTVTITIKASKCPKRRAENLRLAV